MKPLPDLQALHFIDSLIIVVRRKLGRQVTMNFASNNPFRQVAEAQSSRDAMTHGDEDADAVSPEAAQEILQEEPPSDPLNFKTYIVYNSAGHLNLKLALAGSSDTIFYVAHSNFTPGTADLVLYGGANKKSPVRGVVKMGALHKIEKVGLGDPNIEVGPDKIIWEELKKLTKWTHKTYGFEWGERSERKKYEWRRTKQGAWDTTPDLILVEDGTRELKRGEMGPEVLAQYMNKGILRWKKRGTFEIRKGGNEKWETMVLLTGLTLIEGSRRRSRQRKYGSNTG